MFAVQPLLPKYELQTTHWETYTFHALAVADLSGIYRSSCFCREAGLTSAKHVIATELRLFSIVTGGDRHVGNVLRK